MCSRILRVGLPVCETRGKVSARHPRAFSTLSDPVIQKMIEMISRQQITKTENERTHLSLTASCHRCNFAISFTWKPKILGRYLSALNAAAAVDTPSPAALPIPSPDPSWISSLARLLAAESTPIPMPSPPYAAAADEPGPDAVLPALVFPAADPLAPLTPPPEAPPTPPPTPGPPFPGISPGYTKNKRWGKLVPKYAPSILPCLELFGL